MKKTIDFLKNNPDFIQDIAYCITHDPKSGKKIENMFFVHNSDVWIVDKRLAKGHFKKTYLVEHYPSKKRVVLAITQKPCSNRIPEISVAKKLINLGLSGVCKFLGIFDLNTGQKAFLSHFYNGSDLNSRILNLSLTLMDRKLITRCLITAVAEIHQHGIFHRDIKPGNILLQNDLEGNVTKAVLTDFGEATTLDDPRLIKNIEHFFCSPESNIELSKYSIELSNWQGILEEKQKMEKSGMIPSKEFYQREEAVDESVQPLVESLKIITMNPKYDSWSLGLTLYCLFKNKTHNDLPWNPFIEEFDYENIYKAKVKFIKDKPWIGIPKPYQGIIAGLLELEPSQRLSASDALTLLE